jgi:hypothetical protein
MLRYAQKYYKMGGNTNSSFLALIPKEQIHSHFLDLTHLSVQCLLQNNDEDHGKHTKEGAPKDNIGEPRGIHVEKSDSRQYNSSSRGYSLQ